MAEEIDSFDLFVDNDFASDFCVPVLPDSPAAEDFSGSSTDSMNSWIGQIESMLMNDDDDRDPEVCLDSDQKLVSAFFSDMLFRSTGGGSGSVDLAATKVSGVLVVDSPADGSGSGEFAADKESDVYDDSGDGCTEKEDADVSAENNSSGSNGSGDESSEKVCPDVPEVRQDDDEDENDPVAKKRRQLENGDAAVRYRERKKVYLKDLETKSEFLERECVRPGLVERGHSDGKISVWFCSGLLIVWLTSSLVSTETQTHLCC